MTKLLISVQEFCKTADIGRTYANFLIKTKRVASIRLGGRRLIVSASVEALVAQLLAEQTQVSVQRGKEQR